MRLVIPGTPTGKGRHRTTKTGHTYTPTETKTAEARVREAWLLEGAPGRWDMALGIGVTVVVERPKTHFRVNGDLNAAGLRAPHPVRKPDLDNVVKLIGDALNGHCWRDDSQFVDGFFRRRWATEGETERVIVDVWAAGASGVELTVAA